MFRTTLDLHRAKVHKIYEPLPFDKGEMKFFSFVSADKALSLPMLDALMGTQDVEEIMAGLRPAIALVADQIWESVLIEGVRKRHVFAFGDTGRALLNYRSETPPTQVDWILLLVEIDKDVRNIGRKAIELVEADELETVAQKIAVLGATPYGTTAMAAFTISTFLIKAIGRIMEDNRNDLVGYIDQSFLLGDDFGVGRDQARNGLQIQDIRANMWYDYTLTCVREDLSLADRAMMREAAARRTITGLSAPALATA